MHLYKRVQILVGDLWAAYGRATSSVGGSPFFFSDIDQLTMFADYRVPQLLRALDILEYDVELAATIDECREIPAGSEQETEIRACTIVAVDLLQASLRRNGLSLLVLEVDWLLWQRGEKMKDSLKPHHRCRTIYY